MAKFITGKDLEQAIYDIIWEAEETLLIVSPFIKLDDYFKKLFNKHNNSPKLHIIIVFGKNEGNVSRSLSQADFDYFKKFLNVSIVYVPNLHAKYYGNEKKGVITSINLYDYSFINNIEFGVYSEQNIISNFTTSTDIEAWNTCMEIAHDHEVVFVKRPVIQKKLLSSFLGKNYVKSDVLHDSTKNFYHDFMNYKGSKEIKTIGDFPYEIELGFQSEVRPTREEVESESTGYCIRTGEKIPFNPKRPFCDKAYRNWAQFSNMDYPESYCHKTGKKSNGKTSMRNPIMK
ncbi:MAG: phospholipase D family protein [Bacteroidetes bacterium]|nr:phospholipase D family protein [Bacteroidota bacterium]